METASNDESSNTDSELAQRTVDMGTPV